MACIPTPPPLLEGSAQYARQVGGGGGQDRRGRGVRNAPDDQLPLGELLLCKQPPLTKSGMPLVRDEPDLDGRAGFVDWRRVGRPDERGYRWREVRVERSRLETERKRHPPGQGRQQKSGSEEREERGDRRGSGPLEASWEAEDGQVEEVRAEPSSRNRQPGSSLATERKSRGPSLPLSL